MLLAGEAITRDSYRQLSEAMFTAFPMPEGDAPDGLILHTAGESDQGWYVYDVWESKEHFQRFVEGQLGPAMEASRGFGRPPRTAVLPGRSTRQGAGALRPASSRRPVAWDGGSPQRARWRTF